MGFIAQHQFKGFIHGTDDAGHAVSFWRFAQRLPIPQVPDSGLPIMHRAEARVRLRVQAS